MYTKKIFVKRILKTLISVLVTYSGLNWVGRMLSPTEGVRILLYHRINEQRHHFLTITPADFEYQMAYLARHYKVMALEQLVRHIKQGESLPPRSVVITFDDGFKDIYLNAYPVLRKYQFPAAVFTPGDYVGKSNIVNWDKEIDPAHNTFLSWAEMQEMQANRISFGAHTLAHRSLGQIPFEEARSEITKSKRQLEANLGQAVTLFAYPYGSMADFNSSIETLLAEIGFEGACSTINGVNTLRTDRFALRRTVVEASDTKFIFRLMLRGGLDILQLKDTPWVNKLLHWLNRVLK